MLPDRDKIKSYLAHVYPELTKFVRFQNLAHTQYIQMTERYRIFLRIGIPTIVFFFVLITGIWLGTLINNLRDQEQIQLDSPPGVAPIPKESYVSPYHEIKQQMVEFNPSLPDPLYPLLDYEISLEPITSKP